jgi:AcrR family transcriptional regulator
VRNPQQTQRKLIEVASKLMADLGAAGLRVDQVAALAKINKRMIYHYFGDKEGLTAKVIAQQVSVIMPRLNEQETSALLHLFDHVGVSTTDPVRCADQPSTRAQQQAAVILMRALLDRWQWLSEIPIQSLLSRLSALALGFEPQPAHAAEPAASSSQPPQKERISLRPTVSLVQSSS